MSADDIARAEKRGYTKGYYAGQRRKVQQVNTQRRAAEADAFERRAFLAVLPSCVDTQGWKRGDKQISTLDERVGLAVDFAREARRRFYP